VRPLLLAGARYRALFQVRAMKPLVRVPPDAPMARAAMESVRRAGLPPRPGSFSDATDGTYLGAWAHIPNVVLGGGDPVTAFSADEHIAVDELEATREMYRHLPQTFARYHLPVRP